MLDMAKRKSHDYVDQNGNPVRVRRTTHITQIGPKKWVFTKGPRQISRPLGQPPAHHQGCYYEGGGYKFMEHGLHQRDVKVVQDLACEEGPQVWGNDYVRLPDGRHGPTVESVNSPKKLQEYMRLTGHRVVERGEDMRWQKRRSR